MKSITHYRNMITEKGVGGILKGRYFWYKKAFQMNNWYVGRLVELCGNKISIDGVTLSVDNPGIMTMHKSSLYFGIYEVGERELAKRNIDPSLPLLEIGACIGGVSCVTNKILSNRSAHVAVECNPDNLKTLEVNRARNDSQFKIEPFALGYVPTISFNVFPGGWMTGNIKGRDEGTQITVPTITLQKLIDKYGWDRFCIISDSEGSETELVENEGHLLAKHVARLVVEMHPELRGEESVARTLEMIGQLGFEMVEMDPKGVYAFANGRFVNT